MKMDIRADISDAKRGLDLLGHEGIFWSTVTRSLLSALANAGKKWIKGRMYAHIHKRTGLLGKSILTTVKGGKTATISAGPARKAEMLESGGIIRAKKRKYLTFRAEDGSFIRKHEVRIPATHFFTRAADGFEGSSSSGLAIDKAIERVIKKAGMQ